MAGGGTSLVGDGVATGATGAGGTTGLTCAMALALEKATLDASTTNNQFLRMNAPSSKFNDHA